MADVRHAAPRRAFADRNGGGATSSQAIQLRKRSPCVYLLPPNRAQQPRKRHWMNVINIIAPYRYLDMWVFDDPRVGLQAEPFVGGADTMIDRVTVQIPDAEAGFVMIFSATPFPDHQFRLEWRREENGGNVYYSEALDAEGWLCPALLLYFDEKPPEIYVRVKAKSEN